MDVIPEGGRSVHQVGIIAHDGPIAVRLHDTPATAIGNVLDTLPFNTPVVVIKQFPGEWSLISVPSGPIGYVASMYLNTALPEPSARLHRVQGGPAGMALGIAQTYYGDIADAWGQDLRFYVNVLGHVNRLIVPQRTDGWQMVLFEAGRLIWIPSPNYARSLQGMLESGSYSYDLMQSLGLAKPMKRAGQLWADFCGAVARSEQYLSGALACHVDAAAIVYETLLSLGLMILAGGVLLAGATAIGTILGGPAGAAAGFELGLILLEWLGLGMFVVWVSGTLWELGKAFGTFFDTVWHARGDAGSLDRAAKEFAAALAQLLGACLQLVITLGMSWGLSKTINVLRATRLAQTLRLDETRLSKWMNARVKNFREDHGKWIPRPDEVLTRFYRKVEILRPTRHGKMEPVGEFDGVDLTQGRFIEFKKAGAFHKVNPRTGQSHQTPAEWAQDRLVKSTVKRINYLLKEVVATRSNPRGGSPNPPGLAEIKHIRHIEFHIDYDTPALRAAVKQAVQTLQGMFPEWRFTARFGVDLRFPPMPASEASNNTPSLPRGYSICR